MSKLFPKVLYVYREEDGDDHYFVPNNILEDAADLNNDRLVAVYRLETTGKVVTKSEFVPDSQDPPPATPAKRQRRRPEAAPAPAVAPSEGKPPELVDVQAAVEKVFEAKGLNVARGLLSRYGAKRAQEMKSEHYAKFIAHAEQVLAGGEV